MKNELTDGPSILPNKRRMPSPSPWRAKRTRVGQYVILDAGQAEIGTVQGSWTVGESEANAHLFSAAPDLLAACEAAEQFPGMVGSPTWLMLREAIAKAVYRKPKQEDR